MQMVGFFRQMVVLGWIELGQWSVRSDCLVSSLWRLRRAQARRKPKHFLDFSLGVYTPHGSHRLSVVVWVASARFGKLFGLTLGFRIRLLACGLKFLEVCLEFFLGSGSGSGSGFDFFRTYA